DHADKFTSEFLAKIIKGLTDYAGTHIKIMLGGDTRESTEWILQDLATACETFGIEYANVGVLPTPAINYCFYQMSYDFAIDVTASHNPYTDNGIKIFERGKTSGTKLSTKGCETIEQALIENTPYTPVSPTMQEDLHGEALALYKNHLLNCLGNANLNKLTIGIDCANGATSVIGEAIFNALGGETQLIHANANYDTGINHDCGSTHPESLQQLVKANHLDLGVAFDGDGDRCLCVDHTGALVDGDQIIAILADYLKLDQIAITVMANQGILNWAKDHHVKTEITPVGDSNVAAAMRTHNIQLGGEQSGHIILPNETTGDGMLTALMIAKVIADTKKPLHDLASIITKFPQAIVNLPANKEQKQSLKTSDEAKQLLLDYSKKLESVSGRLLVRPSGTEPLIRITMWGNDEATITALANELKTKLGEIL
ncbi:phosphoglucosamine mutase, partial [Candidatus Saccharibacteria bacterium]|nr:phosphoglucosamine mutase [Candidatus Saccharibacteria bacterium]